MSSPDPPSATPIPTGLGLLSLPARIEAILYLKGRPLTLAELAELGGFNRDEAELALITLMADYAHRDTALEIHQEGPHYSLQLRESLGDVVQNLLPVDLSTAALRTLATVALKKDGVVTRDAACGDGPIDAAIQCIERITGVKGKVLD